VVGVGVVVGCWVVGVVVGWVVGVVVAGRVVGGRVVGLPPELDLRVVVVARRVVVVVWATRRPEMPRKEPVPTGPAALTAVVVVDRLGPVVEGAREEAGATVGPGENTVPRASQPGPQRPLWAARAKATVKAIRAKTENPATRTRRLACQLWVRAASSREARSTSPAWVLAVAPKLVQDGDRLAPALTSAAVVTPVPARAGGIGRAVGISSGRERPLQQLQGRVGRDAAVAVPAAVGEHDQLAPVAVADLGQGGVGALAGQVQHDRVGVLQPVAVVRLADGGEPGQRAAGPEQVLHQGGQPHALREQDDPPWWAQLRPGPPGHRSRRRHLLGPSFTRRVAAQSRHLLLLPGVPGRQAIRPQNA
jgi:hypothetical protein